MTASMIRGCVILAAALAAAPARATTFCEVLPTRDGFVALREAPRPDSRLVRRLRSGEDVQIDSTTRPRGNWIKVFYTGADRGGMLPGWVNRRLIARDCG